MAKRPSKPSDASKAFPLTPADIDSLEAKGVALDHQAIADFAQDILSRKPEAASDASKGETKAAAGETDENPTVPSLTAQDSGNGTGNVPAIAAGEGSAESLSTRVANLISDVTGRFMREKRWFGDNGLSKLRDDMIRMAKGSKEERQLWAYSELDRLYPPILAGTEHADVQVSDAKASGKHDPTGSNILNNSGTIVPKIDDSGSIQGLSNIPDGWPDLPANASMSAEIGWVQANRLRIVKEQPGRATVVDLGKALSPAPSWAALGWLETSIRSYAKYVDVAAKVAASDEGEGEVMRRERMSLDEVRSLLDEMRAEG